MSDNDKKNGNGFRNFLLCVIAIALIVIAIPTWNNYQLTMQANEKQIISNSEDNINQARNTLYDNGIVGIMIDSFCPSVKWSFFVANTGNYVVDADGYVPNPSKFIENSGKTTRISYPNYISEINNLDKNKVESIKFHIQFVKNLGEVYETEFNHYSCSFTEMTVKFKDGTEKTINTKASSILSYIRAYLQDVLI